MCVLDSFSLWCASCEPSLTRPLAQAVTEPQRDEEASPSTSSLALAADAEEEFAQSKQHDFFACEGPGLASMLRKLGSGLAVPGPPAPPSPRAGRFGVQSARKREDGAQVRSPSRSLFRVRRQLTRFPAAPAVLGPESVRAGGARRGPVAQAQAEEGAGQGVAAHDVDCCIETERNVLYDKVWHERLHGESARGRPSYPWRAAAPPSAAVDVDGACRVVELDEQARWRSSARGERSRAESGGRGERLLRGRKRGSARSAASRRLRRGRGRTGRRIHAAC